MRGLKKSSSVFLITLLISFMILSCVFLVILLVFRTNKASIEQNEIPYQLSHQTSRSESLSTLILCSETPESLPELSVLLYYDAPQGIVYLLVLPPVTVATFNGRTDTLQGHYDYQSISGCTSAVSELFGVEINRYVRLQKTGAVNLTDILGGLPYLLNEDIDTGDEVLLQGEQLLDGRRLLALLLKKNENEIVDYNMQSKLLYTLMQEQLNRNFIPQYDELLEAFFYNSQTNISQSDFSIRKASFLDKLLKETITVKDISISGIYSIDYTRFYLDNATVEKVKKIIGED